MIRWYPMARATSLLGGQPVVFDLKQIPSLTRCVPAYPPIVRDLETIKYALRRKNFGSRPTAELAFEVKHSSALNLLARYEQIGENQLPTPYALESSAWTKQDSTLTPGAARGPLGETDACLIEDASVSAFGILYARAMAGGSLYSHDNKTALFSVFLRTDTPHAARIDIRANASPEISVVSDFQAVTTWQRQVVRCTFNATLTTLRASWAFIWPAPTAGASVGSLHVYGPDMREIVAMPGTDEQILSDLYDKLCSDEWTVELTLDGGLNWRAVLLQEHEKLPVEEKWIGHAIRFLFECSEPITSRPAALDGRW